MTPTLRPTVTVTVTPTPIPKAASPTFSVVSGTYSTAQTGTISCATKGATIKYTINGATPTSSSSTYTTPIVVSSSQTIKAYAVVSGYGDSNVLSASYSFLSVPGNINQSVLSTSICISWDSVPGATGYDIRVDGTLIDNGANTYYVQRNLVPGSSHTYMVRAKNPTVIGYWSTSVTKTTLDPNTITSDFTLYADMTCGDLTIIEGTVDLNGHKLMVNGSLSQAGGTLNVYGGRLIIVGDYKITKGSND